MSATRIAKLAGAIASVLCLAGTLAACGEASEEPPKVSAEVKASASARASERAAKEAASAEAKVQQKDCKKRVSKFSGALTELGSRLGVGLRPEAYATALGDARVEYDKIDWEATDVVCAQRIGKPLEDAFNLYLKASNQWDKCLEDYDCDLDKDELPGMQKLWTTAGKKVVIANDRLTDYEATIEAA